jgi:hypothetical protein
MSDLRIFKYQCAGCGAYLDDGKVVDMGHGVWTDDGDHYLCGPAHHTPEYIDALEAEVERPTSGVTLLARGLRDPDEPRSYLAQIARTLLSKEATDV